jgi:hypothetical protein
MISTIDALASPTTKVSIIQETPTFNASVPLCLSANASSVQRCRVSYINPKDPNYAAEDQAAAKKTKAQYIETESWFCRHGQCSPVIGSYIPFIDSNHVSLMYASYLSTVMSSAIATDH